MEDKPRNDNEKTFDGIKNLSSPGSTSNEIPEFRCPLCPKFAKITIDEDKNEVISQCPDTHYMKLDILPFIEKSLDHPLYNTKCSSCNNSFGLSLKYCLECSKYLCKECIKQHDKNATPLNIAQSNILIKNNSLDNNINNDFQDNAKSLNLSTFNLTNNSFSIKMSDHHFIDINSQDNICPIHLNEKFISFCSHCNKSFCQKCLEEIKKNPRNNLFYLSCESLGILNHNIKKFKEKLDIENEKIINLENQINLIIEILNERITGLMELHSLKEQLYNLYLKNQSNASLVNTINILDSGFKLNSRDLNTNENLLSYFEIINSLNEDEIGNEKEINNLRKLNTINYIKDNIGDLSKSVVLDFDTFIKNDFDLKDKKEITDDEKKKEIKKFKVETKKQLKEMKKAMKLEVKKKKTRIKTRKKRKKKRRKRKKIIRKTSKRRSKKIRRKETTYDRI